MFCWCNSIVDVTQNNECLNETSSWCNQFFEQLNTVVTEYSVIWGLILSLGIYISSVTVIVIRNRIGTRIETLDKKDMNLSVLPLPKLYIYIYIYFEREEEQIGSFTLVKQPVSRKENSEFKPVIFCLKNWPCAVVKKLIDAALEWSPIWVLNRFIAA